MSGPGTELTALFLSWGVSAETIEKDGDGSCGCKELAAKMDGWRTKGCRSRLSAIVKEITDKAERMKYRVPLQRKVIERFILVAIRRAERWERDHPKEAKAMQANELPSHGPYNHDDPRLI